MSDDGELKLRRKTLGPCPQCGGDAWYQGRACEKCHGIGKLAVDPGPVPGTVKYQREGKDRRSVIIIDPDANPPAVLMCSPLEAIVILMDN